MLFLVAFLGAQSHFLWKGFWATPSPTTVAFHNEGVPFALQLRPSACQFEWEGKKVGWGEWLLSLRTLPNHITVVRQGFRWLVLAERRIAAFAFADLPPTKHWSSDLSASLQSWSPPQEQIRLPIGNWQLVAGGEGAFAFAPPEGTEQKIFPLLASDEPLTEIFVTMPVQPNGARSIGIGVCWDEDGGYLWRWRRVYGEARWELAVVTRTHQGWDFEVLHEEVAAVAPTDWHRLQVWRCADQLWVGVDSVALALVKHHQYGWGKVVVWVEEGDRPPPLIQPLRITPWAGVALNPDIQTGFPFLPVLNGEWRIMEGRWVLKAGSPQRPAIALLGEPQLPAWWIAEVQWRNEPVGLVFGWQSDRQFAMLRLSPLPSTPLLPHRAALELVTVHNGKERVLDQWQVALEPQGLFRLALHLTPSQVNGFVNGLRLVYAHGIPAAGKVGLWAKSQAILQQFWLYEGANLLVPLTPEAGGNVQPLSEHPIIAHEVVAFTLPEGLPPKVPLSARLSQEPITLFAERQFHQLLLRIERNGQLLGITLVRLPTRLPLTIRLERRDRLLLVWIGDQPVWTLRLP